MGSNTTRPMMLKEISELPLAAYPGRVITNAHIKPMRYPITATRGLAGESEPPMFID
jgi:hypothetical protein